MKNTNNVSKTKKQSKRCRQARDPIVKKITDQIKKESEEIKRSLGVWRRELTKTQNAMFHRCINKLADIQDDIEIIARGLNREAIKHK